MSAYVLLKYVHVVAAIVAIGTNVTYLYWLRRARAAGEGSADDYTAVARRTMRSGGLIMALVFVIEFLMVVKPG